MFRLITQIVYILDLSDLLFAITRINPYHRKMISTELYTKIVKSDNDEFLNVFYKRTSLFSLSKNQVRHILINTRCFGYNSLIQSKAIRYHHDRRLILHKILECIREKLTAHGIPINELIQDCFFNLGNGDNSLGGGSPSGGHLL